MKEITRWSGACSITRRMFETKDRPQALVLSNNATTLGFLKGLTESGADFGRGYTDCGD